MFSGAIPQHREGAGYPPWLNGTFGRSGNTRSALSTPPHLDTSGQANYNTNDAYVEGARAADPKWIVFHKVVGQQSNAHEENDPPASPNEVGR
jgi:hypothetical protein